MSDTVPALKIATKALIHARAAEVALKEVSTYSHTNREFDAAKLAVTRCIELLDLIAPETLALPVTAHDWPAPQPDMAQIELTQ